MNGMSRKAIGISSLPLAILLSLSMISEAGAADAAAPAASDTAAAAPAAEQVEELEQILVRGKRLSHEITEAEDAFFAVYNKVNRNYEFGFTCGEASMNPGSMIMLRTCLPTFVVDAYRTGTSNRGQRAGLASYPTVIRCSPVANLGTDGAMFYTADAGCMSWGATYERPSLEALVSARSTQLAVHMLMVINSDLGLKQLAGNLARLYQESNSMRTRYERITPPVPDAKAGRVNRGPRAL